MTISAQSIALQWSDGSVAFENINFTLTAGFHGLVGRNGSGKSSLARVLAGSASEPVLLPSSGSVHRTGSVGYVGQADEASDLSLAEYLNATPILNALQRIAEGSVNEADFELVGEQWTFAEAFRQQLLALRLWDPVAGFDKPVALLSGGERSRLRLFKAFSDNPSNLILDEPSNHLDAQGRDWLIDQCRKFSAHPGHCLLVVSHDRQLLQNVQSISELNSRGLQYYEGNYAAYADLAGLKIAAAQRQLKDAVKHKKLLKQQLQRTREKAQKRQSKGKSDRAKGGQAKVMLDFAKENAQQTTGALSTQMQRQQAQASAQLSDARQRLAALHDVQLHFKNTQAPRKKRLLSCEQLRLPHGAQQPLNLTLAPGDKIHLLGANGSGKSTLLKVFAQRLQPLSGHLMVNTRVHVLDQGFSLVAPDRSVLDNLMTYVEGLTVTDACTALAQAGLTTESVSREARYLSGGETMKLAMLMVTQQPELLLFDEPDNHLDIQAKQQLAQAIRSYSGALVVASHDATLINEAGIRDFIQL